MDFIVVLLALIFLMFVAYRGFSVILFAPIAAMGAVLLTDPSLVGPVFSGLFMKRMVFFVENYFPVFLLGALFGKVIELSGFSKSIVSAVINFIGKEKAITSIVVVCLLLTYGGVSMFVVVFAVYPFAAEMFKQSDIPKRLIPGTVALGSFSVTMDALPGTPQIQNIIPTTFFGTNSWAAPWLGVIGSVFILIVGLIYLEYCRRSARARGEGYGTKLVNEPVPFADEKLPNPVLAISPLVFVGVLNFAFTHYIPTWYAVKDIVVKLPGLAAPITVSLPSVNAIWAVEAALLLGILLVIVTAFKAVYSQFAEGSKAAIGGALLASMNTAAEFGFGGVIAALPGFIVVSHMLSGITNPLVREAVTVTSLAGITGSASGGMSIALAAMADTFKAAAHAANIPMEVLHRVASMASGGMDTLPHNGAVITVLAATGLTHRESYKDIFAVTCIKTAGAFFIIAVYYLTGLV